MTIDLHIHSRSSDGKLAVAEIMIEAKARNINFLSITDHDSISCQEQAGKLAKKAALRYVCGVELNITFSDSKYLEGKPVSLDFLGYNFDPANKSLFEKLVVVAKYREERASKIMDNLNKEFEKEGISKLSKADFADIEASADGVLGRPHIADYLVKRQIVSSRQEAFDKYLVKCDVPKYPVFLEEASRLVRNAGGKLILAHPNDPHGTSLHVLTKSLQAQTSIVHESMLSFIDGVECWHSRHDAASTEHYRKFCEEKKLLMTGGSDCHQKPIMMGSVSVPAFVAEQF